MGQLSVGSLHFSSVHATPAEFGHTTAVPAMHPDAASYRSVPLQYKPSEHFESTALNEQSPVAGSHASVVHAMPSSHGGGAVPFSQPVSGLHFSMPSQAF